MSRKRFQLLQRFLHFQNNQDPQSNPNDPDRNKLFKMRTLMNMVRQKFISVYYPPGNLTVDESLVLYNGRLVFKQYIRTKKARYGIKMVELVTADDIPPDFMIYQGNIEPSVIQPLGQYWLQTEQIYLTMMDPCLDRGHTLTIDNWCTTPRLAKYLLHRSTKVVGTVRSNRNNFQKIFQVTKRCRRDQLSSKGMKTCWQ